MSGYKKHIKYRHPNHRHANLIKGTTKLVLNFAVLAGFALLIRHGYLLFTHKLGLDPFTGSIVFIVEIVIWVLLIKLLRSRRYKSTKPSFKLTTFSVITVILIFTFAGVQPLATYKDDLIKSYQAAQIKWTIEREEAKRTKIEELEHNVVELVNAIRNERGSAPLIWDNELYTYSKQHSEDMASQKRLFHSPINKPYAENAWGGEGSTSWTASDIVKSWMSSPQHRTWLLCPHLKHIAVGIAISDTGMYASWTFWRNETQYEDWWYVHGTTPPDWWY